SFALLDYRHYKNTNPPLSVSTGETMADSAKIAAERAAHDVQDIVSLWKSTDPGSCIMILGRKKDMAAIEYGIRYMFQRPKDTPSTVTDLDIKKLFIQRKPKS